jgi:hypothetical protein
MPRPTALTGPTGLAAPGAGPVGPARSRERGQAGLEWARALANHVASGAGKKVPAAAPAPSAARRRAPVRGPWRVRNAAGHKPPRPVEHRN